MADALALDAMEEETRALRALAEGMARQEGLWTGPQVGHFERASQAIARMRRLDPEAARQYIRLASEARLLREAIGTRASALFLEVEYGLLDRLEGQYSPADLRAHGRDYLWLVTRAVEGVRTDRRVQAAYQGREAVVETWIAFNKRFIIPYYRALAARSFQRRYWREWTEPLHWLW